MFELFGKKAELQIFKDLIRQQFIKLLF